MALFNRQTSIMSGEIEGGSSSIINVESENNVSTERFNLRNKFRKHHIDEIDREIKSKKFMTCKPT